MTDIIAHELLAINGIGEATLNKLMSGGIDTVAQLSEAAIDYVVGLDFTELVATKLITQAVDHLIAEIKGKDKPEDKEKEGFLNKIKSALTGGASVAPTVGGHTIRMRTKRHSAPRHRKR